MHIMDIRGIDEFPIPRYRELAKPVTEEHLRKNLRHWELRLDRVLLAEYPCAERRFYWLNDGAHTILVQPVIRHAAWALLFHLPADSVATV